MKIDKQTKTTKTTRVYVDEDEIRNMVTGYIKKQLGISKNDKVEIDFSWDESSAGGIRGCSISVETTIETTD